MKFELIYLLSPVIGIISVMGFLSIMWLLGFLTNKIFNINSDIENKIGMVILQGGMVLSVLLVLTMLGFLVLDLFLK